MVYLTGKLTLVGTILELQHDSNCNNESAIRVDRHGVWNEQF